MEHNPWSLSERFYMYLLQVLLKLLRTSNKNYSNKRVQDMYNKCLFAVVDVKDLHKLAFLQSVLKRYMK